MPLDLQLCRERVLLEIINKISRVQERFVAPTGEAQSTTFPETPSLITRSWRQAIKQFTISYLTKVMGISES
jgi:hypothetical protein